MNISLINPGESTGEGKAYGPLTSPHMGLAYIASSLASQGHQVDVIEMPTYGLDYMGVLRQVENFGADVVGITARSFNILSAYKLSKLLKNMRPDLPIILGGAHGTALPEHTLTESSTIDVVVLGYGEYVMCDLVRSLESGNSIEKACDSLPGVCFRKNGVIVTIPPAAPEKDLDLLPSPDFSMYDISKFGMMYHPAMNKFHKEVSIFASRGCPFKCTFCMAHGGAGIERAWNVRSPENVIAEMMKIYDSTGIDVFGFNDSTFGINKKWFLRFCEHMIETGLYNKVNWSFETRADLGTYEIFKAAVEAGCNWVFFGFESGSEKILSTVNKGI
jgi:anaerobic magnesium-protoporphyrin IX monomethyl ester cyclase